MLNEKPIESSTSIHSVARTLTKKEKDKRMDSGKGERQRELQKRLKMEREKMERAEGEKVA